MAVFRHTSGQATRHAACRRRFPFDQLPGDQCLRRRAAGATASKPSLGDHSVVWPAQDPLELLGRRGQLARRRSEHRDCRLGCVAQILGTLSHLVEAFVGRVVSEASNASAQPPRRPCEQARQDQRRGGLRLGGGAAERWIVGGSGEIAQ